MLENEMARVCAAESNNAATINLLMQPQYFIVWFLTDSVNIGFNPSLSGLRRRQWMWIFKLTCVLLTPRASSVARPKDARSSTHETQSLYHLLFKFSCPWISILAADRAGPVPWWLLCNQFDAWVRRISVDAKLLHSPIHYKQSTLFTLRH